MIYRKTQLTKQKFLRLLKIVPSRWSVTHLYIPALKRPGFPAFLIIHWSEVKKIWNATHPEYKWDSDRHVVVLEVEAIAE